MSTWEDVQASAEATGCRCPLAAGMTRLQIDALGGGCQMPDFCCPTLDKYRRLTKHVPDDASQPN